jgi:hypothetical protein
MMPPVPAVLGRWAPRGRSAPAWGRSTSPCGRRTPPDRALPFRCARAARNCGASTCRPAARASGTVSWPAPGPAWCMAARPRPLGAAAGPSGSTRPSCCSTPGRRTWWAATAPGQPGRPTTRAGPARLELCSAPCPRDDPRRPDRATTLPSRLSRHACLPRLACLSRQPQPSPPLARADGALRGHVRALTDAPPGHPARAARQLRRAGPPGDARALPRARHHHAEPAAAALPRRRGAPAASRPEPTTGATRRIAWLAPSRATASDRPGTTPAGENCAKPSTRLHAAGLEVVLDVVFNHTAELDAAGADAVAARPGQCARLPPGPRQPQPLPGLDRLRQQR